MEWFFSIFDKIIQSYIWKKVLSHLEWMDWVTAFFAFLGPIYGAKRGLLREIVECAEVALVLFLVFTFDKPFA